jgi:hypothetical protein
MLHNRPDIRSSSNRLLSRARTLSTNDFPKKVRNSNGDRIATNCEQDCLPLDAFIALFGGLPR